MSLMLPKPILVPRALFLSLARLPVAKHLLDCNRSGVFGRKPFRPRYARRGIRARAGAVKLGVSRRLLALGLAPVVPALRANAIGHLAVQKRRRRERAPGSAEECFHVRVFRRDRA